MDLKFSPIFSVGLSSADHTRGIQYYSDDLHYKYRSLLQVSQQNHLVSFNLMDHFYSALKKRTFTCKTPSILFFFYCSTKEWLPSSLLKRFWVIEGQRRKIQTLHNCPKSESSFCVGKVRSFYVFLPATPNPHVTFWRGLKPQVWNQTD